jgi:hypothetical protein
VGIAIGFAAPAAAQAPEGPATILEWVAHTTPQAQLEADLAAGIRRFWVVCGISCRLPGRIDDDTYRLCYRGAAMAEELAGTTDNPKSRRQDELQPVAARFAGEYNALLAEQLDKDGRRDCPFSGSPENWLEPAHRAMARLGADSGPWLTPHNWPEPLAVQSREPGDWRDADAVSLCAALAQGGLTQRLAVRIRLPGEDHSVTTCERGAVLSALKNPAAAAEPPSPRSR